MVPPILSRSSSRPSRCSRLGLITHGHGSCNSRILHLCKCTNCVEVCRVDVFYDGKSMLVIHSKECIDCRLRFPMCPVNTGYSGEEVPVDQQVYIKPDERFVQPWPVITLRWPLTGPDGGAKTRTKAHLFDSESAN